MGKPKTPRGWFHESARHALARKGIKTKPEGVYQAPRLSPYYTPAKKPKREYTNVVDDAKNIRKDLKKAFPGANFSVRSSRYSMGSSIHVRWVDGPATNDVEEILHRYEQIDRDAGGNILKGGNRFIFAERSYSPEAKKKVEDAVRKKFAKPRDFQAERWLEKEVWRTLQATTLPRSEKTSGGL
jgi:hypothetical protein